VKIIFDIEQMKPACVLLQAAMGGDIAVANAFNSDHWLINPTPGMKCFAVTPEQLQILVQKVKDRHG